MCAVLTYRAKAAPTIEPTQDNTYDLGSSSKRFRRAYLGTSVELTPPINLPEDGGAMKLVDMSVTSSLSAGTEVSFTFELDDGEIMKVYGESDGAGGIQNAKVQFSKDIDIGGNLLKTTNLALKEGTAHVMYVRDDADSVYKHLRLGNLFFGGSLAPTADGVSIEAKDTDNYYLAGKSRQNTVGLKEVYRMVGAAEPRFGHTLPLNLRSSNTLTISTGAITIGVGAGTAWYKVNGEGAAADDLDSINGGATGDIIILMRGDANITLRDAADSAGNIVLGGTGVTFVMDDAEDIAVLFYNGSNWCMLSRQSNG